MSRRGSTVGGLGFTTIDDEFYFNLLLATEITYGKFGVGLGFDLNIDGEGEIREEDWDDSADWLGILRYFRYGRKHDPLYFRMGILENTTLGHGFIMYHYTNQLDDDTRKTGFVLDVNRDEFGVETVVSSLGGMEILGGRGFFYPLKDATTLPVVRDVTLGMSYVTDVDPHPDSSEGWMEDDASIMGIDAEVPLLRRSMIDLYLYSDFAHIVDHGSGAALGIGTEVRGVWNLVDITARLERRFLGEEFLPSFFDAFYERDRVQAGGDGTGTKLHLLEDITRSVQGTFGELGGSFLGKLHLLGNFEHLDGRPHSGRFHLEASAPDLTDRILVRAWLDKTSIEKMRHLFEIDENTRMTLEVGYRIQSSFYLLTNYLRTFYYDEEEERYRSRDRTTFRLEFRYHF